MRLRTILFLVIIVVLAFICVLEMSGPFDVISGYSTSGNEITLHGAVSAIGFFLIVVGFGNFLGRSANVTIRLIRQKDIARLQEWVIELMISGFGGIVGILLWYYLGILRHI